MSPASGDSWPVEQSQTIKWDTTGLEAPLNIHLVPSGAVDATIIIAEIAVNVANTGSFQWAPPNTITVADVEVIIVDAKQIIVISEVFIIVIVEVSPFLQIFHSRNPLTQEPDHHDQKVNDHNTNKDIEQAIHSYNSCNDNHQAHHPSSHTNFGQDRRSY